MGKHLVLAGDLPEARFEIVNALCQGLYREVLIVLVPLARRHFLVALSEQRGKLDPARARIRTLAIRRRSGCHEHGHSQDQSRQAPRTMLRKQ
jgi:hypothetical protein